MAKDASLHEEIVHPQCNDVICGKGSFAYCHPGNIHFRNMISKHKLEYVVGDPMKKLTIAQTIVDDIQSLVPPGRFLKKKNLLVTKSSVKWVWEDIGPEATIAKTRQMLRVGANEIKNQRNALRRAAATTLFSTNELIPGFSSSTHQYYQQCYDRDGSGSMTISRDTKQSVDYSRECGIAPLQQQNETHLPLEHNEKLDPPLLSSNISEQKDQHQHQQSIKPAINDSTNYQDAFNNLPFRPIEGSQCTDETKKRRAPDSNSSFDQTDSIKRNEVFSLHGDQWTNLHYPAPMNTAAPSQNSPICSSQSFTSYPIKTAVPSQHIAKAIPPIDTSQMFIPESRDDTYGWTQSQHGWERQHREYDGGRESPEAVSRSADSRFEPINIFSQTETYDETQNVGVEFPVQAVKKLRL